MLVGTGGRGYPWIRGYHAPKARIDGRSGWVFPRSARMGPPLLGVANPRIWSAFSRVPTMGADLASR